MKFKLTNGQRLVTFATEEGSSRVLRYVHIKKNTIEACNGTVLIQKQIEYKDDKELLLNASDIAGLEGEVVEFIIDGDKISACDKIFELQTGIFPDTDKLYPAGEPVFKIVLGRGVLLSLLNSLEDSEDVIRLYFYGSEKAVKFEVNSTKGLILPIGKKK